MNVLSLISFFNAYSFIILGVYIIKLNSKEVLNRLAGIVSFCFAIWAFTYTFFYSAETASVAMLWHKIGSFGWILFCAFAAHFFLILSEKIRKCGGIKRYVLLYGFPVILLFKALFSADTPVAKDIVQSKIGWGWTYDSNIESIWFWLYIVYILIYFCISLYLTYSWAKKSGRLRFLKQAKSIIFLDGAMILIGSFTDLILPAVNPIIPPIFILISIVWGTGFLYIIRTYKLMSVYNSASPDLILKTVIDPIIMLDHKGFIMTCNQATMDLFKYSKEEMINRPLSDFCESKEYGEEKLNEIIEKKILRNVEINLMDSAGNIINAFASFSVAENRLDGLVGIVVDVHDITKLKKIEEELYKKKEKYKELSVHLYRLANYDKLTDIPNRRLFFSRVVLALEKYKRSGSKFALVFIDLDYFKSINDSYGHNIGDLLLVKVANIFVASIRKQDVIARVGGDEFVIIFTDLQGDLELNNIIKRMKEKFLQPIIIKDISCTVGISLGISKCPEDGITTDELMRIADERMYKNKNSKKTYD